MKQGKSIPTVLSTSAAIHNNGDKTFYDSVTLQFDTGEMRVFVGEVVAMASELAVKEESAKWFPWKEDEPWSAVQILSMYKTTDGQYKMDFRWFWRYNEFLDSEKTLLKDHLPTKSLLAKSVVESNSRDTGEIHHILGRVVLTSQEEDFSEFSKKYLKRGRKPVPQVGLLCKGYFDFHSSPVSFMAVDNWTGEVQINDSCNAMMMRGFNCLEGSEILPLIEIYEDSVEMRHRLEDVGSLEKSGKKRKAITAARPSSKRRALGSEPSVVSRSSGSRSGGLDNSKSKTSKRSAATIVSLASSPSSGTKRKPRAVKTGQKALAQSNKKRHSVEKPSIASAASLVSGSSLGTKRKSKTGQKTSTQSSKNDMVDFLGQEIYIDDETEARYYYRVRVSPRDVFKVGDLVAAACNEAQPPSNRARSKKWRPFNVPWSPAQILSFQLDENGPQVKIKWFSRLGELESETESSAKDCNEKVGPKSVFETEYCDLFQVSSILGYIAMVHPQQKNSSPFKGSCLPGEKLTCRHQICEDKVTIVNDWDDYDPTRLHAALNRGLDYLDPSLRGATIAAIEAAGEGSADVADEEYAQDDAEFEFEESSETAETLVALPTVQKEDELMPGTNYYRSVTVPVYRNKCAPRVVSKTHKETWKISIGEVVCVQNEDTKAPNSTHRSKKRGQGLWYPFQVPWTCCQVLGIYTKAADVYVEVRWFPRASSIDDTVFDGLQLKIKDDELVETAAVELDISASNILGRVNLSLGHHTESGDPKTDNKTIPTVSRRCKYYYDERVRRIQPIFCGDTSPGKWHQRLIERGIKWSQLLQRDDLKTIVDCLLGGCKTENSLFADLQTGAATDSDDQVSVLWSNGDEELLLETTIIPPWHHYVDVDNVCHVDDREAQVWTILVGDVVAALKEDANAPTAFNMTGHRWSPYNVNWSPCQIVSVTRKERKLEFEVRWLFRSTDLGDKVSQAQDSAHDHVYESTSCYMSVLNYESLLGPLSMISLKPTSIPPFLPHSVHVYGGVWSAEDQNATVEPIPFAAMMQRSIQCCSTYDSRVDKIALLQQILDLHSLDDDISSSQRQGEAASPFSTRATGREDETTAAGTIQAFANESRSINDDDRSQTRPSPARSVNSGAQGSDVQSLLSTGNRVSTSISPFHVDKSALRAYFTHMDIEPPFNHYAVHGGNQGKPWKVEVGDIVILHSTYGAGKTFFDPNHRQDTTNWPYLVKWAVAEIVAIWKTYARKKDLPDIRNNEDKREIRRTGDLELEIRWYWRRRELPGLPRSEASKLVPSASEEIFETDHIDRCSATSVMAPANVHFSNSAVVEPLYELGMPVPQFSCSRFWSFHRRSIVPFASASGRQARSRMYSICLTKDDLLRDALERSERKGDCSIEETKTGIDENDRSTWKEAFQEVVRKLSLTQASEDAFGKGVTLLGRHHEQDEITSFLRQAIKSANKSSSDGSKCASMFVAGPPGTGKTVSVCSIIGKLRHEQVGGRLPDFDFFSLNGMEMRHPFEAYVKFWEAISGTAKERLAPDMAIAKLERYFSGLPVKNAPERPVIVLMLDEIDYLVTKKQTVLYNFFDWPKRSFETPDCPRLIVIGISNTMNLPSQLRPSVRSRLGGSRCNFKAYNVQDIVGILKNKIQPDPSNYEVFDKDAILFTARKIAANNGDIRRAMQTCKAATESVMQEIESGTRSDSKLPRDRPMVGIKDVQKVTREKIGSVTSNALAALTPFEALVLVSLAALSNCSGRKTGGFDIIEVVTKAESVANASGDPEYSPSPSFHEMLEILNRLAEARLVRLTTEKSSTSALRFSQGGSGGVWPVITPHLDGSDILLALRHGSHSQLAEKQLAGYGIFY